MPGVRRLVRAVGRCAWLVLLATCKGSESSPTAPIVPIKLAFITQPSSVSAGATVSPAVQVTIQDAQGNPVSSATATITLTLGLNPGGGTLSGTATAVTSGGVATFTNLSIDKVGSGYTLVASASGLSGATSAGFNVTAGPATKLAFLTQPTSALIGASITPSVQVAFQDAAGNTVTSSSFAVTIAIGTNPSGATLSGTTIVNAVNGVATFSNLSINKTGTGYTLVASYGGPVTGATSSAFDITTGPPAKLAFTTQPSNATAGAAISPSVQVTVQDAQGNTVTGATNAITITIGTNPASGALSGTATVAAISGVATFAGLSIDKAGSGYTLTAAASGLTGATSNPITIAAGAASKLAFSVQPSNVAAGAAISPAIQVLFEDAQGNPINGGGPCSVTLAIGTNPSGGTISSSPPTYNNAVATFSGTSIDKVGTGYTLVASCTGLTSATSAAFNVTSGAASKLVFSVQPTNVSAATAISPAIQVTVQDAQGNTVTGSTASITLAIGANPAGGSLSGTATVAAASGVATFSNLSVNKAGSGYTLTANAASLNGATSNAFNVTIGSATKVAFTVQPTNSVGGAAITPAVQVAIQDAGGNTVTSATTSITVAIGTNPGGGTLSGTTTVAASSGVATFSNLSIDNGGTGYTLTASASSLTGAVSSAFNVTIITPTKLVFTVQPSNATSGAAINPAVQVTVQDAQGNTATNSTASITIAIGTNPASGTLSGAATVAAVSGVATFSNLSIDKLGSGYTLTAAASGLSGATSGTFNVSAGAASKLVFSVQPSSVTSATAISPAVQVSVQDAGGNAVTSSASISIAIGTNPASGTLTGNTFVAASSGVATFSNLSIDKSGTGYTLTAASAGLTGATSTGFNVTAGAASKLAFTGQPTNTASGTAITPAVAVSIQDAQSNTVTAATNSVTVAIGTNPASGTLSGTATVTAVSGVATLSTLMIDKAGTGYTLTASASGLTGAASASFNVAPGAPAKLAFTAQPTGTTAGTTISPAVQVIIRDAQDNAVTSATNNVTVAIGTNPSAGVLAGAATSAAASGVASFSTLSIDKAGAGYTLTAAASGLAGATSSSFSVFSKFGSVSAGGDHTCGLTLGGIAFCWGLNSSYQLGDSTASGPYCGTITGGDPYCAVPEPVQGGFTFASVSSGNSYSCALTSGGAAYCWGDNHLGQLGNGTLVAAATPVAVSGGLTFTALAVGGFHACGLNSAGAAYCWGFSRDGELGSMTATYQVPSPVAGGLSFTSLTAGGYHTCGLTSAGVAYCWGNDGQGRLGDGDTTTNGNKFAPSPVLGGLTFVSLSAGGSSTCGLTSGGAAYCWGDNGGGQLGIGTSGNQYTPTAVAGGISFASISVGGDHACGLTSTGAAYCWGGGVDGQAGAGTQQQYLAPVAVVGGLTFTSLVSGGSYTCAVIASGVGYCWGQDYYGQIGDGAAFLGGRTSPVRVLGP